MKIFYKFCKTATLGNVYTKWFEMLNNTIYVYVYGLLWNCIDMDIYHSFIQKY